MRRPVIVTLVALAVAVVIGVMMWEGGHIQRQQGQVVEGTASDIGGPFTLTDQYGRTRRDKDFRGRYMLVYFGYTNCPDICPTTLANLSETLRQLGPKAKDVRILFVSIDPDRDTLPVLKAYVHAFAPEMDGLRGTTNAIAALARRYRVAYSVTKPTADHAYEVMHSAAVFFFDAQGHARLVTLSTDGTAAVAADIARLEK